jgi:hypothetical protein
VTAVVAEAVQAAAERGDREWAEAEDRRG